MLENILCERINEYNILYVRNSEYSRLHLISKAKQVDILNNIVSKIRFVCLQVEKTRIDREKTRDDDRRGTQFRFGTVKWVKTNNSDIGCLNQHNNAPNHAHAHDTDKYADTKNTVSKK